MSLTFYYVRNSTAEVTRAVLAELAVPHERVTMSIQAGDTLTPTFTALNPNGRVPVIVHEGAAIWEACAITMYLGEQFGVSRGLYPPPGPARGLAMKWIAWGSVTLAEAGGRLSLASSSAGSVEPGSRDWVPPERRSPEAAAAARADLTTCLDVLASQLDATPYLAGDFGLADVHVFAYVGWLTSMDVELADHGSVQRWFERCSRRPALASLADDAG